MDSVLQAGRTGLLILSFWGDLFILYRFVRIRSWFVPAVCMAGTGLILYWGVLADVLPQTADLLLACGLAGFFCFLAYSVRGKVRLSRPDLFHLCFFIGAAVFAGLSLTMRLTHYDNFSHWAVIVKYLLGADRLPGADAAIDAFRDYPPGSSLLIYYVCRYAGHSQGIMLLAQNSLILACFYAVFGIVKERRRFLLYSFLGMGCAMLSYLNLTVRINNLLVDFLLPLMALASAAASYRCREQPLKLCLVQAVLLGYTGIIKETGLFFAGAAGVYAFAEMMRGLTMPVQSLTRPAQGKRRRALLIPFGSAVMLLGIMLPAAAWQVRLGTELAGYGRPVVPVRPEQYAQVAELFYRTALDPSDRAFQAVCLCAVLSAGAVIYGRIRLGKWWRLTWILPAASLAAAGYYAGMLYMYLHAMPADEALRLAGFKRYACSAAVLYAGFLIMGAAVDIEHSFAVGIDERGPCRAYSSPGAKRRYQYAVLVTMVVGINFLYSEYSGLLRIRDGYEESLPAQAEHAVGDRWYEGAETDRRPYRISVPDRESQAAEGELRYIYRYFLWAEDVEICD